MIVAIHQPNYLPWLGYFHKVLVSDVFVFFDNAQFTKGSFINRNRVKTANGWTWVTVPVKRGSQGREISEVEIEGKHWARRHLRTIKACYRKAKHYSEFEGFLDETYNKSEWDFLAELNIHIVKKLCRFVGIEASFVKSSDLNIAGKVDNLSICKALGASVYFSGSGGSLKYMEEKGQTKSFNDLGMNVVFQRFEHPEYEQRFGEFIPNLSFIDLLFNEGYRNTLEILKGLQC